MAYAHHYHILTTDWNTSFGDALSSASFYPFITLRYRQRLSGACVIHLAFDLRFFACNLTPHVFSAKFELLLFFC